MRTGPDCLPCLLRQTLAAARFATADPAAHERLTHQALGAIAALDPEQSPPAAVQTIQRLLRQALGNPDPYRAAKDRFNTLALALLPELRRAVAAATDPFATAVRFAIAGNVIDLGTRSDLTEQEARDTIRQALHAPLMGDMEALRQAVAHAPRILYLADNAGEIVLDRLLIERLPPGRVTVAVRGGPVLNDATRADALLAGLDAVAEIIANGSDAPGTRLTDCTPEFQRRFRTADVILAKGQGNYGSLVDRAAGIFFLFRVKCDVVAAKIGHPLDTQVIWRAPIHAYGKSAANPTATAQSAGCPPHCR